MLWSACFAVVLPAPLWQLLQAYTWVLACRGWEPVPPASVAISLWQAAQPSGAATPHCWLV